MASSSSPEYKVFISHAGEDKSTIAIPLREMLQAHGVSAFVDETDMSPGIDAEEAMMSAMESAQVGVVVLSPEFVARKWPIKELFCFLRRYDQSGKEGAPRPVIIPFFYRLGINELYDEPRLDRVDSSGESLYMKSRFLERMSGGEPEANIAAIKSALRKLHKTMGVRNDVQASNDSSYLMSKRRNILLQELCKAVKAAIPEQASSVITPRIPSTTSDRREEVDEFRPYHYTPRDTSKLVHRFFEADGIVHADTQEGKLLQVVEDMSPDTNRAISAYGIGGVGKTSILRGISTLERIKGRFKDGVHLLSLGMDASERKLISCLSGAVERSGGGDAARKMRDEKEWVKVVETFQSWFRDKQCLFLVDDVWETSEMSSSMIHALLNLHVSGRDSKVLLTTRNVRIASRLDTCLHLEPYTPFDLQAREILTRYCGIEPDMEKIVERKAVEDILEKCCGLALFLAIAGRAIRALSFRKGSKGSIAYRVYAKSLSRHMQDLIDTDVDSYERLRSTVSLSIKLIGDRQKSTRFDGAVSVTERYSRLCVIEKNERVPLSMLRHLWELKSEAEAAIVAREFEQMGLVEMEMEEDESGCRELLSLHDSLHLFAVTEAEEEGSKRMGHEAVLNGYGEGIEWKDGCRAWWSRELESDGYIHKRVCRHLLKGGYGTEVVRLLLRPSWTVRQFEVNGIAGVVEDYSLGATALDEGADDEIGKGIAEAKEILLLISEAASLSPSYVTRSSMRTVWFQLYGRLTGLSSRFIGIKEYLDRIEEEAPRPWLRCVNPFLTGPGGANEWIISLEGEPRCLTVMKKDEQVACGLLDGRIVVINTINRVIASEWKAHDDIICAIATLRNGERIVSASEDGMVKVWDTETYECVAEFEKHNGIVTCVAVTGDGKRVISGSLDGTARVRDIETGQELLEPFRGHQAQVWCVAVFRDGVRVITGGADKALRIWSMESGIQVGAAFIGHEKPVACVGLTPDERKIVSRSEDETIRIWNADGDVQRDSAECVEVIQNVDGDFQMAPPELQELQSMIMPGCMDVSKDGKLIAFVTGGTSIRVWDLESGRDFCDPLVGHGFPITRLEFLSGSNCIVSCSFDYTIRMWNLRRSNFESYTGRHDFWVRCVCPTLDGRFIISGSWDRTVRVWDSSSGLQVGDPMRGHSDVVNYAYPTDDGRRIFSISKDEIFCVWDFQSHQLLYSQDFETFVNTCESSDWELVSQEDLNRFAEAWDAFASTRYSQFAGNGVFISSLTTGTNEIWDSQRFQLLAKLESQICCVTPSPDGKTICLGFPDGKIGILTVEHTVVPE